MGQHDIEEYFKSKLDGHTRELDTDRIWNALDLPKQKKRKRFLWWFVFAGLGLILAAGSIIYDHQNISPIRAAEVNENSESQFVNSSSVIKNSLIVKDEATVIIKEATVTKSVDLKNKSNAQGRSELQKKWQTQTIATSLAKSEKENSSLPNNNFSSKTESNKPISNDGQAIKILEKLNSRSELAPLNNLAKRPTATFIYDTPIYEISELKYIQIESKKRRPWSLAMYSGIFKIDRTLQSFGQEADTHVNSRSAAEQPLEMLSAGVAAAYQLNSGITLLAGFEYARLSEKFDYQSSTTEIIDNSTALFEMYSSQTTRQSWTNFNYHEMLIFPLGLAYYLPISKWNFGIQGKMLIALHRGFTGRQLGLDGFVTETPLYYSKDIKFGYSLSADLTRRLNSHWSVSIQPSYQVYETSFVKAETSFAQYYKLLGINMGLQYQF